METWARPQWRHFYSFFCDEGMDQRLMVSATSSRSFTSIGEVWRRRGADGEHRCMPKTFWQTTERLSFNARSIFARIDPLRFQFHRLATRPDRWLNTRCNPNTDRIRFDSSRPSGEIVRIDADVDAINLRLIARTDLEIASRNWPPAHLRFDNHTSPQSPPTAEKSKRVPSAGPGGHCGRAPSSPAHV